MISIEAYMSAADIEDERVRAMSRGNFARKLLNEIFNATELKGVLLCI